MKADDGLLCSQIASQYGVPLVGKATRGDIWFLIEYPGSWGEKAFEQSEIPAGVKEYFYKFSETNPFIRTLLIRKPGSHKQRELKFFVGLTHPMKPLLFEYQVKNYSDLLKIDLESIIAGLPVEPSYEREEPLYLVCTNGKRDKCCAIYGPGIYHAMAEEAGDAVWQSSHIGGHNKAPVALFFPYGVNYGRTTPSQARNLVKQFHQGKVVLSHYRGRVCFDDYIQAGEHYWREQTGILNLPGMQVESVTPLAGDQWRLSITDVDGCNKVTLQVQRRDSNVEIPVTCRRDKNRPILSFNRVD
jgi:hypothetical protein